MLGSMLEAILVRFVIYFGALGGQEVIKMSSTIDAQINIGKRKFREGMSTKGRGRAGGQEGVRGGGEPPGGRSFGRKEVKKKARSKVRKFGGNEGR